MQIRVKCSCGENCPEWAMIELQGVVEVQPQFQDHLQNLKIGLLCRPSSSETYTFTIGYHELTGTKLPLKKPLLVMNKVKDGGEEGGPGRVELEVIGIIRYRILFKTRPKALISKAQPIMKDRGALAMSKYRVTAKRGMDNWKSYKIRDANICNN